MKKIAIIQWNMKDLIRSLGVEEPHVLRFLKDGRNSAFLLKFRLSIELGWELVEGQNAPTHLISKDNKIWIIKTCTPISGVSFCSNSMIGKGRKFESNKFIDSLKEHEGFLVADVSDFPTVEIYQISSREIFNLYMQGMLNEGRIRFNQFKNVVKSMCE